jgi:hypothetical protein
MIYQIRSYLDLCCSKAICESIKEIKSHVDEVIKATEAFRRTMTQDMLDYIGWKTNVTKAQLLQCFEVTQIDETILPEYKKMFDISEKVNCINLEKFVEEKKEAKKRSENNLNKLVYGN